MKPGIAIGLLMAFAASTAWAATEAGTPSTPPAAVADATKADKPLTAQQQRMKSCNAEAKTKELKGDPRKTFMKSCLSNKS